MYAAAGPQLSDSNQRIIEANNASKRVYQVWKGSNRFFLGGRLVFGPDVRSLFFTIGLIAIPVILFAVFVSAQLAEEIHSQIGYLILSISVIFAAYVIFLLLLTSGKDPGIIPRNAHPPEPEDEADISNASAGNHSGPSSLPPAKDVVVNNIIIKVKYCHTCMLYRPPRCSHCSICNNCVERFDHHCPWVGQCIGKRNYRFFFMFVLSTSLLCVYVFIFCWVNLKKIMDVHECNLWRAFLKSPISGILIIYTFIAFWFVGGLTAFHLYLICTNQTTYENFRYRYDKKTNPHNLGCAQNVSEIFLSRIPSSKTNFRAKMKDNSVIFTSSHPALSQDMPKMSVDLEVGGKRQTVAEEELDDIQSQIDSIRGSDGCNSQLPHSSSRDHKGSWETTPDIGALAAELGMERCLSDREKTSTDIL
ncbi:probable protein S-acyltransferase 7 [Phalaenopsis equestris]|uniref:probable protein S-acyltransferase 7 n=1 Tax=Phalaenopsis equestris TaxID=78828 RepID=UPI0009E6023F|nr:probable protein S-acyltransferase 7 [Phalaenopsis equestris]XP_020591811.1 probable protein S-acyltransferase 7 [Phalaenopsis equestris]